MNDRKYPHGKLNENDEGALTLRIGIKGNRLIIDFGKQVIWIGFTREAAIEFARLILNNAEQLEE